jgi:hypothetical protein
MGYHVPQQRVALKIRGLSRKISRSFGRRGFNRAITHPQVFEKSTRAAHKSKPYR